MVAAIVNTYVKPSALAVIFCVMILGAITNLDSKISRVYKKLAGQNQAVGELAQTSGKKMDVVITHVDEGIATYQQQILELSSDIQTLKKELRDIKLDRIYKTP